MGPIEDSLDGIFDQLKKSATTLQRGGGIGCDFSTLLPDGAPTDEPGRLASGPVRLIHLWNTMCASLISNGTRCGAMMATLRCDHPDIIQFVDAKRQADELTFFNLSVLVSDQFIDLVRGGKPMNLWFPSNRNGSASLPWPQDSPADDGNTPQEVFEVVSADSLWQRIISAAYDTGDPGVLFVDRINRLNNLYYCEKLTATNPCGESPLPAYGACNLGSINLTAFVSYPFSTRATLDTEGLAEAGTGAVRFLDNIIDVTTYPLPEQARQAAASRRVGLGITGLGDALAMMRLHYDSDAGREVAHEALETIRNAAYRASIRLAVDKESFPQFERDAYLGGTYIGSLPDDIRDGIAKYGIRNSHLMSIAPAGTISLLAGNISSGIEPIHMLQGHRRIRDHTGEPTRIAVTDKAYAMWQYEFSGSSRVPDFFVAASDIPPEGHLLMQASLQPLVDQAISKTINVREDIPLEEFAAIYQRAFDLGLKGCTVFRPNEIAGSVLSPC